MLFGEAGDDVLVGGAGNDRLQGGDGRDLLLGQGGDDVIFGGLGADWVFGGAGNDTLYGGAGRDIIDGGDGVDVMRGGADADIFRMAFGSSNGDAILDFDAGEGDRLMVRSDRAIAISDLGEGFFSFTDGVMTETLRVAGATLADFELLIG
jgi:Ca2+-binding RTX toxin-like protein